MVEITDYQYAYFNKLIYGAEEPDGPVEHFFIFKESKPQRSGLAALALCATEVRTSKSPNLSSPEVARQLARHHASALGRAQQVISSVLIEVE